MEVKKLFLENTSKKMSLTLRYGDGLSRSIQIAPLAKHPLPLEMSKGLLQSYLHLFKDLKVVEEGKTKVENNDEIDADTNTDSNDQSTNNDSNEDEATVVTGQDTVDQTNSDQAGQDDTTETDENGTEESQESAGDASEESTEENLADNNDQPGEDVNDQSSNDETAGEGNEGQPDSESTDDAEDGTGEAGSKYTEKQLSKLSAEEVKALAAELGIEVTEDATKKALIPVILNKQEEK